MRIKAVAAGAAVGLLATQAFGATNDQIQQELNSVLAKQKQLQAQVTTLKQQLANERSARVHASATNPAHSDYLNDPKLEQAVRAYSKVSFGSYLNQRTQFNGSDLIINAPSILEGEALLDSRYSSEQLAKKHGYPMHDSPYMTLSGVIEGQANYTRPYTGAHTSDLDLTDAELDVYVVMSKWVSGLLNFAYNNDTSDYDGANLSRSSADNSQLFVNKAFVTFGNFAYSPWYVNLGQMYVPFGRYSSSMISKTLPRFLFRTKARALEVGYHQADTGFYGEGFIYRGDAKVSEAQNLNNVGLDGGYKFNGKKVQLDVGASYENNVANADGMQDNGFSSGFRGFGHDNNEKLVHRVGGYDLHGSITLNPFNILAEYTSAISRFSAHDATYNGHGAKPSAYNVEGAYTFMSGDIPSSVALGFGGTDQALAFSLPKRTYGVTYNLSIWKDTLLSFEFRRNQNYNKGNTATGAGSSIPTSAQNNLGRYDNVFTTQFDMYF